MNSPSVDAGVDTAAETDTTNTSPDAVGDDTAGDATDAHDGAMFTSILDRFDRADGALDSAGVTAWTDGGNQGLSHYAVAGGELSSTPTTAVPIWWNAYYGGSAAVTEAFITVRHLSKSATDFSLLLVSQTFSSCDFLQVRYDPGLGSVEVASCQLGATTVYGGPVMVGSLENRRLAARFDAMSGRLEAYVDAEMVGSWTIDQWRYVGRPGRIGIWLRRADAGAEVDTFDDFGGR